MKSIKLRHVFIWTCPDCDHNNEVLVSRSAMTEDMLRQAYNIEEWEPIPEEVTGDVMQIPVTVNCRCGELFNVDPPDEWI